MQAQPARPATSGGEGHKAKRAKTVAATNDSSTQSDDEDSGSGPELGGKSSGGKSGKSPVKSPRGKSGRSPRKKAKKAKTKKNNSATLGDEESEPERESEGKSPSGKSGKSPVRPLGNKKPGDLPGKKGKKVKKKKVPDLGSLKLPEGAPKEHHAWQAIMLASLLPKVKTMLKREMKEEEKIRTRVWVVDNPPEEEYPCPFGEGTPVAQWNVTAAGKFACV